MSLEPRALIVALVAATLWAGVPARATEAKDKTEKKSVADQFDATLVTMTGPTARGLGDPVTIWVDAYTSDTDAQKLLTILAEKGQTALRDALGNYRAGRLRIGTSTSYPIAVARQIPAADGRIVRLATNAPLTGFQIQQGMRSQDYPIGFIELKLKSDGTGEGTVVGMAQVSFDEKGNLNIASYATSPGRLTNVRTAKKP
jgi:hypothetical protein